MILVEEAEKIILAQLIDFGMERVPFESSLNRVLAEDIIADRDLPPFNRVTLDGIAINYASFEIGHRSFDVKGTQAAGDTPVDITAGECIEIMTGAALPATADTVIGYEDLEMHNSIASVKLKMLNKGQGVHIRGKDKNKNEIVAKAGQLITPAIISIAASVGKAHLKVKNLPKVVIISSGDELVDVGEIPFAYQIRRSNSYMIKASLQQYNLYPDTLHIPDDLDITKQKIRSCLERYDAIILSGGISMGKFDYVPQALQELSVEKLFHKVKQRPGKPFWFGAHENVRVFALPGNPVSTFMCLYRYVLPWLKASAGLPVKENSYAVLGEDVTFRPALQYFLQVKLHINKGAVIVAIPVEGNNSGDFANLAGSDAFMELPAEQDNFTRGEIFKIWPFQHTFFM